jgi:hypothetical protein
MIAQFPAECPQLRDLMLYPASRCKCHRIDGATGTSFGQARERQNPVGLTKLAADIPVPLLTQDEPSASVKRLLQQGHSPSNPFDNAEKADGCGIVMIALNASGARWA